MKFIITPEKTIIYTYKNQTQVIPADALFYDEIHKHLVKKDFKTADKFRNPEIMLSGVNGYKELKDIYVDLARPLIKRLLSLTNTETQSLVKMLANVKRNKSETVQKQLLLYLINNGLPITPDGKVLAYKAVTDDYKDYHTKTYDNRVGKIVKMNMKDCNMDNLTCGAGLHVANFDYASNFGYGLAGGKLLIVEVNPKDIISVDKNDEKFRTLKYKVLSETKEATLTKFVQAA